MSTLSETSSLDKNEQKRLVHLLTIEFERKSTFGVSFWTVIIGEAIAVVQTSPELNLSLTFNNVSKRLFSCLVRPHPATYPSLQLGVKIQHNHLMI